MQSFKPEVQQQAFIGHPVNYSSSNSSTSHNNNKNSRKRLYEKLCSSTLDGSTFAQGAGGIIICRLCGYRSMRIANLRRHVQAMHRQLDNKMVLSCCDTRFPDKATYRDHCRTVHKNGHQCQTCQRVFTRRALLSRHQSVHTGIKEFSCHLCSYATSHKSNLERHFKTHLHNLNYCSTTKRHSRYNIKYKPRAVATNGDNDNDNIDLISGSGGRVTSNVSKKKKSNSGIHPGTSAPSATAILKDRRFRLNMASHQHLDSTVTNSTSTNLPIPNGQNEMSLSETHNCPMLRTILSSSLPESKKPKLSHSIDSILEASPSKPLTPCSPSSGSCGKINMNNMAKERPKRTSLPRPEFYPNANNFKQEKSYYNHPYQRLPGQQISSNMTNPYYSNCFPHSFDERRLSTGSLPFMSNHNNFQYLPPNVHVQAGAQAEDLRFHPNYNITSNPLMCFPGSPSLQQPPANFYSPHLYNPNYYNYYNNNNQYNQPNPLNPPLGVPYPFYTPYNPYINEYHRSNNYYQNVFNPFLHSQQQELQQPELMRKQELQQCKPFNNVESEKRVTPSKSKKKKPLLSFIYDSAPTAPAPNPHHMNLMTYNSTTIPQNQIPLSNFNHLNEVSREKCANVLMTTREHEINLLQEEKSREILQNNLDNRTNDTTWPSDPSAYVSFTKVDNIGNVDTLSSSDSSVTKKATPKEWTSTPEVSITEQPINLEKEKSEVDISINYSSNIDNKTRSSPFRKFDSIGSSSFNNGEAEAPPNEESSEVLIIDERDSPHWETSAQIEILENKNYNNNNNNDPTWPSSSFTKESKDAAIQCDNYDSNDEDAETESENEETEESPFSNEPTHSVKVTDSLGVEVTIREYFIK